MQVIWLYIYVALCTVAIVCIWSKTESSPSAALQRDASSQSTRPMAYMSILKKASLWKLMAPSSTSGAIYLLVPTCMHKNRQLRCYGPIDQRSQPGPPGWGEWPTCPWVSPGGFPGSNRTARPKSPTIAVRSVLSMTFLLLKSLRSQSKHVAELKVYSL